MKARVTAQSEFGKIEQVLIKSPQAAFQSQAKIDAEWEKLHFTHAPDFHRTLVEFAAFESILKKYAGQVHYLEGPESLSLDSIYCRDAALATDQGMILGNMGKPERKEEPDAIRAWCTLNQVPLLGSIQYPGTLEGGDVAWIDERTLAVGHTYRTNKDGIDQVKALLEPFGLEVIVADLPHYKGPGDVFHLMSIFSPVDRDLAVVYSPLMPVSFRNTLLDRHFHLIEVPDAEFESMACNVLALGPRICLMVEGNPRTAAALRLAGCTVYEYEGTEISMKGGGGPTCLTRPLKRRIQDSGFY